MPDDLHAQHAQLRSEIEQLQGAIASLATLPDLRHPLEAQLAEKQQQLAVLQASLNGPSIQSSSAARDIYIATQQTINHFFDGAPSERGRDLLHDYLDTLADDCDLLRLARLRERRHSGAERRTTPALRLQAVYTSLTTDGEPRSIGKVHTRSLGRIRQILARVQRHAPSADRRAPEDVRGCIIGDERDDPGMFTFAPEVFPPVDPRQMLHSSLGEDTVIAFQLTRLELATDAVYTERRLVLLGEPGYGKSTVLRYLALLLARRLRGQVVNLIGWPQNDLPVPILCPLGSVAAALAAHNGDADQALWQAIGDVLDGPQGLRAGLRAFLAPALRRGGVLLLLDGLDELPVGTHSTGPRHQVMAAVQRLAQHTQARIVVTSRVLPYRAAPTWQLPAEEGWAERTIQPLAFGQVRTFVHSWYTALVTDDPDLTLAHAEERATALISQLSDDARMRPLVQSPLLLTMLALLHYNSDGDVPRDRARLYHECVQLLLERWEPVRTLGLRDRASRLQLLLARLPGLDTDKLRDVIHALAFEAHEAPPGDDGRGQIDRYRLTGRLIDFFKRLGSTDFSSHADTFLEIIREEAGLLVARDDDHAYAFPHLTFQEYLAACWLADQSNMADIAYGLWVGNDRERWRTTLLLLTGRLRQKGQKDVERDGVPWLQALTGTTAYGHAKPPTQRRRDAVLAALSYAELGGRNALVTSLSDLVRQVEDPLRQAIVELLETPDSAISTADRIAAARVLVDLQDPRFPVTIDQWRDNIFPTTFGHTPHYWCYMPQKAYSVGSDEPPHHTAAVDIAAFWIARFPITVAQYTTFVKSCGYQKLDLYWTSEGRIWQQHKALQQPITWRDPQFTAPNQPLVGITWYEAAAFCRWLTEQLLDLLPPDYSVRLPTEAEWEAAATDGRLSRRPQPWGDNVLNLEYAIYRASGLDRPAPVGCCPAGRAACGALDLVGNIWELATSSYQAYPDLAHQVVTDFPPDRTDVPWRGGSYYDHSAFIRSLARDKTSPDDWINLYGFRVVVGSDNHRHELHLTPEQTCAEDGELLPLAE